jgi:hypothetical protein
MSRKGYMVLGWVVWQFTSRFVKFKVSQNRAKLGAAGVVLLVLVAGVAVAKGGDDS